MRGFGTWVCWWWDWRRAGLGEAASALQGREEKAFRCLVGELLRAPLPWSKSPKPLCGSFRGPGRQVVGGRLGTPTLLH